jgi:hypothetical protein
MGLSTQFKNIENQESEGDMDYKTYFKQYKTNRSLLKIKKDEEQQLIRELFEIQTPSIKAQEISDMPLVHSDTSPVERFAVRSEKLQEELNAKLKVIQGEVFELQCKVNKAEACLENLTHRERFTIEQYYLEDLNWPMVSNAYQCRYRQYISIRQLQRIEREARSKISEILQA